MQIFKLSDRVELRDSRICTGKGVFATNDIAKGDTIIEAEGEIAGEPTRYTVQVTDAEFLYADYIDNFINHSCSPNVYMKLYENDKRRYSFFALKNIRKGDELFWNYNTNYWDVGSPLAFPCSCGSKNCATMVRGFKYLTKPQQREFLCLLTPYPRKKLDLEYPQ